ncbi:alpha/beta hydrolase fold-domain-containing protein [Aspergillus venezuelensis]
MTSIDESTFRYAHYATPDPEWDKYKDIESPFAGLESLSLPKMREILSEMPIPFPYERHEVAGVEISHRQIEARDGAELELRIYKHQDTKHDAVLFFVTHGGGWAMGDHNTEETVNQLVAKRSNSVVVSVNYRLAPEFPFPYAVNDSFDALQWCRENAKSLGIDYNRVIVGGSSSGGNIAAALALKDRDEGIGAVFGQVLNFPDTCHPAHFPRDKHEYYSPEQNKDAPVITTEAAHWLWDLYCPTCGADPYSSPLLAETHKGLAPALIQVAGRDPGRDEALAYSESLKRAGVAVKTKMYAGLPHAFHLFPDLEATMTFHNTVVDWINFLDKDMAKIIKFDKRR